MSFSKTQLDRLGNRLRLLEPIQDEDRLVYAEYRASYQPALARVSELVRRISRLPPSARLKTLESTIQKLRRQTIRLSQVDDIAGCRIVVGDLLSQDRVVSALVSASAGARIVDRRARPQHGYRAVHVVCRDESGQDVEVQVRTRAQDMWANVSEAAATNDLSIKYGGGDANLRQALDTLSEWAKSLDEARKAYLIAVHAFEGIDTAPDVDDATPEGMRQELTGLNLELDRAFSQFELLVQAIAKMVGR